MEGKNATLEKHRIRILLVDDHPIIRRGIRESLSAERDFEVCAEAGDISSALRILESVTCDLILLDLSLGQENGIDLIRQVKEKHPANEGFLSRRRSGGWKGDGAEAGDLGRERQRGEERGGERRCKAEHGM